MEVFETIFLGLLQGVAEFLPISSSGHLSLGQYFFNIDEAPLTLNIALHAATLLVVFIFYRKKIISLFSPFKKDYLLAIFITCIPTGIIGLGIKKFCEGVFENASLSAYLLMVNGIYLFFIAKAFTKKPDESSTEFEVPNPIQAFIIGIVQGIAVLPGLSRSGLTIGASKLLGMKSSNAVEYSLIASLPVISGAVLLEARKMSEFSNPGFVLLSALIAVIAGWFSVKILLKIVKSNAFKYWGIYCFIAGFSFIVYTHV
jgi:undecaprenyl-diphosphatase